MTIKKRLAALGAAMVMGLSMMSIGASATSNPYSYGTTPVAYGKVTQYSGNRYTSYGSTSTSSSNITVGVHVTQHYTDSTGASATYGTGDADSGQGAAASARVTTPSGGKYKKSVISHSRNNTTFATYTLTK